MNEFLHALDSIVYSTFHLNSGSDCNYSFSLYAKHYKTSYLFFTRNLQIQNTCLHNNRLLIYAIILTRQNCY